MQKVTIDCTTGAQVQETCSVDESTTLSALAQRTNPASTARNSAEQMRADMNALVTEYRARTTTEPVTGKQS